MLEAKTATTGFKIGALLAAAAMVIHCGVSIEGDEGNLTFHYLDSDLRESSAAQDLAVGAKVDVQVSDAEAENDDPLEISDAYSDDAQTIDAIDQREQSFRLEALDATPSEGTRIHAEAIDEDGEALSDSVSIGAAEVDEVELDSRCDGLYFVEATADFNYKMYDDAGERLTGYGHYPVSVEPSEGGEIDEDHGLLGSLQVATGSDAGEYEIVDEDDESLASFELLEGADVEELDVAAGAEDTERTVSVGEENQVAIFAVERDDQAICGDVESVIDLSADDDSICEPRYEALDSILQGLHFIHVEGLEAGDCEVTLEIPDAGLQESFDVTVE